jgi:hypothetical protein
VNLKCRSVKTLDQWSFTLGSESAGRRGLSGVAA